MDILFCGFVARTRRSTVPGGEVVPGGEIRRAAAYCLVSVRSMKSPLSVLKKHLPEPVVAPAERLVMC
jgi:hypothetical protein